MKTNWAKKLKEYMDNKPKPMPVHGITVLDGFLLFEEPVDAQLLIDALKTVKEVKIIEFTCDTDIAMKHMEKDTQITKGD